MKSLTRPITTNRKFIDFPRPIGSFERYCTTLFAERGFEQKVALRLTRLRQLVGSRVMSGAVDAWDTPAYTRRHIANRWATIGRSTRRGAETETRWLV